MEVRIRPAVANHTLTVVFTAWMTLGKPIVTASNQYNLSDSDHIKACYLTARSIRNKFSDLEELVATEKFAIIAITESWLNTKDRDFLAEYNLPGIVTPDYTKVYQT